MELLGRTLILRTAAMPWIERLVRRSRLFRPLVGRFVAGDTLESAMGPAEALCERGFRVSLDLLGENTHDRVEAVKAKDAYIDMLERVHASPHAASMNISIKMTQCGLDLDESFAEEQFREVLKVAAKYDQFVRVDMEASDYTERTISMIERVFPDHKSTGTVLQSYLYRTPDDAQRMIRLGARVRIVKGAYLEPESVAFPKKSDVDAKYIEVAKELMMHGNYPAIATHDESIIRHLKAWADEQGIAKERFEWQMLYGIRRDLQDSLRQQGYNVRVYIPFGDQWYPYFTRRLAERPANALFIFKSLFRG